MKGTLILLLFLTASLWAQPSALDQLLKAPLPRSEENLRQIRIYLKSQPEDLVGLRKRPKGRGRVPFLVYAIESADLKLTRLLLSYGAHPDTVSGRGDRPAIHTAVLTSADDKTRTALIEVLISMKADLTKLDTLHRGILHALVESKGWDHQDALRSTAQNLIKAGAALETEDVRGFTPLLSAVMRHDAGMVKILIELGADPNRKSGGLGMDAYTLAEQQSHTLDHPVEAKAVLDALP